MGKRCWNVSVRFSLGVTFLGPGGWNLRRWSFVCLSWSAVLWEAVIKCHYVWHSRTDDRWCHHHRLLKTDRHRTICDRLQQAPPAATPNTQGQSCGHWHAKRFRWVVGVAYPLTGALLPISHASADCVSSVGKLQSRPRCVYVTCTCEFICLPSEERRCTCWESTQTLGTWSFLHERYVKRRILTAKRCRTKLELTVSLRNDASLQEADFFYTSELVLTFCASSTSSPAVIIKFSSEEVTKLDYYVWT